VTTNISPEPSADLSSDALVREQLRKYVRVNERRPNGLVAFEFAIGWPDLAAELVLPEAMFQEFCATHKVEFLVGDREEKLGDHSDEH
jgi:phenol hydroxylase P0 protein